MSTIDDLLFAPIHAASPEYDFLVRWSTENNRASSLWDWKPVTDRALTWVATFFRSEFDTLYDEDSDGWLTTFYGGDEPDLYQNPAYYNQFEWFRELVAGNFSFKVLR